MIGWYDWAGGREAMLRFGPDQGPVVVVAMPLLEEWNRTRAFVVALLRALAERNVASMLPDLPGHGESLSPLPGIGDLRTAMAAAATSLDQPTLAVGIRGGALLDAATDHAARWHLSPTAGAALLRDIRRVELAGGALSAPPAAFTGSLPDSEPSSGARTVRLIGDPRPADRHVAGSPLWRRAEPGNDPLLAATLADDIAAWTRRCAG